MQISPQLLEKYHLDLCTPHEKEVVMAWLANGDVLGDFEKDSTMHQSKGQADTNMRRFLAEKTGVDLSSAKTQDHKKQTFPTLRIAATALLFGCLTAIWFHYQSVAKPKLSAMKEIRIPFGKKGRVTLSDGTDIYLNSGTVLSYPERFDDSTRQVILTGEAFFKVAPDARHAFIVKSSHQTQVRVLGTAFNIRAYDNESQVEVSVEEGKVKFINTATNTGQVLLTAGQSASYSAQTGKMVQNVTETSTTSFSWKNNQLIFQGEKMTDVVRKLERWYNIKIKIDHEQLPKMRYSGSYSNPELYQLLKSMGFVMGFKYKVNETDTLITIY